MKMEAGKVIEIVYMDNAGKLSQRNIDVRSVRDGLIQATDLQTRQPRAFKAGNILAWQPARRKGVTA
ncbi:hypothetical protein ACE6ED_13495 [Paenibacillus sp. CN-4]|uniref:hypothetical protein n=1 Tax=Paenibacillus nanchangensis TaxID=3348343 RepID=UPI00397A4D5F